MSCATLFLLVASSLAIEFLCAAPLGLIGAADDGDGSLPLGFGVATSDVSGTTKEHEKTEEIDTYDVGN